MRPTGALHLGHYHGVLKNWLKLQAEYPCYFFVADWHALTTHYDTPDVIEKSVWDMVIDWLAAGIDPTQETPTRLARLSAGLSARFRGVLGGKARTAAPLSGDIPLDRLVDAMLPMITVTPVRGSRLVDLAFTSADPEFAAKAANILAEEYVAQNLEFRVQNSDKTLQFLEAEEIGRAHV